MDIFEEMFFPPTNYLVRSSAQISTDDHSSDHFHIWFHRPFTQQTAIRYTKSFCEIPFTNKRIAIFLDHRIPYKNPQTNRCHLFRATFGVEQMWFDVFELWMKKKKKKQIRRKRQLRMWIISRFSQSNNSHYVDFCNSNHIVLSTALRLKEGFNQRSGISWEFKGKLCK